MRLPSKKESGVIFIMAMIAGCSKLFKAPPIRRVKGSNDFLFKI
jgi:hypothetical protein